MKRRKFLGVGIGIVAVPFLSACRDNSQWVPFLSRPTTVTRFCDEKELIEIGRTYLTKFPDENSKGKLADLLLQDQQPSSENDLQEQLDKTKKMDFESGKSVILKGWVLSRTEARQCALYTLTAK